jgi:hypothetical protein
MYLSGGNKFQTERGKNYSLFKMISVSEKHNTWYVNWFIIYCFTTHKGCVESALWGGMYLPVTERNWDNPLHLRFLITNVPKIVIHLVASDSSIWIFFMMRRFTETQIYWVHVRLWLPIRWNVTDNLHTLYMGRFQKMPSFCGHCNQGKTNYIFSGLNDV